jgi:hypothetical protein
MLTIDPFARISVENALEHPFVLWENEVDRGAPPLGRYTGTADGITLTEMGWKGKPVYCSSYHQTFILSTFIWSAQAIRARSLHFWRI